MKKIRFSETQIVAILKEADSGMLIKDICRKHGISDATCRQFNVSTCNLKPALFIANDALSQLSYSP